MPTILTPDDDAAVSGKPPGSSEISRKVSFWLLIGMLAAVGLLFFRVIQPFIVAIFVGLMLAVLFAPAHRWLSRKMRGHDRIAAGTTTALVILLVLFPIGLTLLMAGRQAMQVGQDVVQWLEQHDSEEVKQRMTPDLSRLGSSSVGGMAQGAYRQLPPDMKQQMRQSVSQMASGMTSDLYDNTRGLLSDLFTFIVSFSIMALGLYYFLADGDTFIRGFHRLVPLEYEEEEKLVERFHRVCRGVVLGTVVAGMVQALLSGAAFAVLGVEQVWGLMVLTMFCSFIPIVGATVVWGTVAAYLVFEGRVAAGVGLAIYGSAVIATVDNLVRAYVIGNQARLHPLVALISVLGALKLMGLWGLLVGPMIAAFFYALLNIVRERLVRRQMWDDQTRGEVISDPDDMKLETEGQAAASQPVPVRPH